MSLPESPAASIPLQADYPDWLNPMLVKELRQGLRKGAFTAVFVTVQAAMILLMGLRLLSMAGGDDNGAGTYMDVLVWGAMGMLLLLIMPLRGVASIQEEKKIHTLELVQMSWLGSLRIVFGKWIAIVSQTLLFTVSILPYAVLRYFFGGMEILQSFEILGLMLLASMTFSACGVWLSTTPAVVRGVAVFFATMLGIQSLLGLGVMLFGMGGMGGGMGTSTLESAPALIFGATVTTLFMLVLAASRIAAAAENHSITLRCIALSACLAGCLGTVLGSPSWISVVIPVLAWAMIHALTERTSEVPSMYAPWLAWGLPGRLACRVLNPGWASGLLFTFFIVAMLIATEAAAPRHALTTIEWRVQLMTNLLIYLALVSPVFVIALFRRVQNRGALYLGVQALGAVVAIVARFSEVRRDKEVTAIIDACTPTSAAIWALYHPDDATDVHWQMFQWITLPMGGLILLFLLWRALGEFRIMRVQELKVSSKLPRA